MVQPLGHFFRNYLPVFAVFCFSPLMSAGAEEYIFMLPLTKSVTQIEKGVSTRMSSRPGLPADVLQPSKVRVYKKKTSYFYEQSFEDRQSIKKEITLLKDSPEQIAFYWAGEKDPRMIVFSKLSESVVIVDIASFQKERGEPPQTGDFTEAKIEYGSYVLKR